MWARKSDKSTALLVFAALALFSGDGFAQNSPPVARFTATPDFGVKPTIPTFDARTSKDIDGRIVEFAWNYGDGKSSSGTAAVVSHRYANTGTFTAQLTVKDDLGATSTATRLITVIDPGAGFDNTQNTTSPLGSNLAPVTDFTAEYPFANYFKQARVWTSGNASTGAFDDGRTFRLDPDGYITSLKLNQIGRAILFTGLPADPSLTDKVMVLGYDGDGEFSYTGRVSVISQSPGRDVIRLQGGDTATETEAIVIINLIRTNPANPVRNIRLTEKGGICRSNPLQKVTATGCPGGDFVSFEDAATHGEFIFNPSFLGTIKSYRSLRFMDWLRTNNSTLATPLKRPLPGDAFWSTDNGVPIETIIALANLMDFDPWINIPHLANDAYVKKVASLLRGGLETAREAYIEYSNETWNGIFVQAEFVQSEGERLGLDQPEDNRFIGGLRFYSRRAQQVFDIFASVYGAQLGSRVERVMATQAVNPFLTQTILEFEDAATKTDAFAIAPYFGDTIVEAAKADEIKQLGVDGVFDWLLNDNNSTLDFGSLASLDRAVADQKATVDDFGIPLITYEGGQHFLAAGAFGNDVDLNAIMDAVNRDPRMKTVYNAYLSNWRSRSSEVFWHYVNCDRWSRFGRWGAREFPTQSRGAAPKADALLQYIAQQPLP